MKGIENETNIIYLDGVLKSLASYHICPNCINIICQFSDYGSKKKFSGSWFNIDMSFLTFNQALSIYNFVK